MRKAPRARPHPRRLYSTIQAQPGVPLLITQHCHWNMKSPPQSREASRLLQAWLKIEQWFSHVLGQLYFPVSLSGVCRQFKIATSHTGTITAFHVSQANQRLEGFQFNIQKAMFFVWLRLSR